eukprot:gnl/Carplike_NY0171/4239_a5738_220.p1 GENE.gnl/Carplike_NY0171/4239_a5738_220~~gnl/Carplike_NY0171/4239_a5738_220.p1  ORF type:complete len:141 (+),score=35.44 gnl/Carplike_NY0171/4239_a5738_220:578-1000(+)
MYLHLMNMEDPSERADTQHGAAPSTKGVKASSRGGNDDTCTGDAADDMMDRGKSSYYSIAVSPISEHLCSLKGFHVSSACVPSFGVDVLVAEEKGVIKAGEEVIVPIVFRTSSKGTFSAFLKIELNGKVVKEPLMIGKCK